ncbi:hypothetical protein, partial [Thalassospira sp.]|uniref:hypothetical protein n=1 Tax=Thalassospira sp. TaxID=1912094 RepID=UPI002734F5AD
MRLVAGRACPDRGGSQSVLPGELHGGRRPEVCPVPVVVTGKTGFDRAALWRGRLARGGSPATEGRPKLAFSDAACEADGGMGAISGTPDGASPKSYGGSPSCVHRSCPVGDLGAV